MIPKIKHFEGGTKINLSNRVKTKPGRSRRCRWLCTVCHFSVAAGSLVVSSGVRAAQYSVTDLGPVSDLAGRTDSAPMDVNDSGQVAAVNVQGGAYRALLYSGSWKDLGTLGGGEGAAASLNQAGQVAGSALLSSGLHHAFLWTPGGTDGISGNPQMKDLGALQAGGESFAYSINRAGLVAGAAQVGDGDHAVVYSAGQWLDISTSLKGLPYSFGYSINDSGHVAGTAYDAAYTTAHAFFYNGQTTVDLGKMGGSGANGIALNNADTIVGYYKTAAGVDHAFRFAGGNTTDLGTLGGHYSYANAINNQDAIVGGSFVDVGDSVYHAFISSGSSIADLNQQLDSSGAGWVLTDARAISDSGLIVGLGNYSGGTHFFLLSPAFRITGVQQRGADLLLSFNTPDTASYSIQSALALGGAPWSPALTGIAGTGGITSVTLSNAFSGAREFFRVVRN